MESIRVGRKLRVFADSLHNALYRSAKSIQLEVGGRESARAGSFAAPGRDATTRMADSNDDLWVFGYGSLMWRPGFDYLESALAWVHGYHRSLCVFSHVHRGTPERPGLVLGLDYGGSCQGVAFRVAAVAREATIAYLRERELVTSVYLERMVGLRFADGGTVRALTFVVDRRHEQYAGRLPIDQMARMVGQGVGVSGDNPAYVRNTYEHLLQLDIHDPALAQIVRKLNDGPAQTRRAPPLPSRRSA
jgi:cation transport protein ChaC